MPALIALAGPAESAEVRAPSRLLADDAFQQDCLKTHNAYRARHGVPAMQTSPALVDRARQWATRMAATGHFGHHPDSHYGENLHLTTGKAAPCADAVKAWYDTIKDYDFDNPGFSSVTGFFTQVVWKSSTQLGCGRATRTDSGRTKTYIVCDYNPAGNMVGADGAYFRNNVFPPR
ncbi:CAP family protein [Microtetraspora niveoalba]|uniref:CAP family protein n=1 Tax=Microtetraspora niveoalba TaxID=46175 RepID=UPI0008311ACB|nr:CAP family protein [Microtetraspora niveoalba]